jgi:hypothetical protein
VRVRGNYLKDLAICVMKDEEENRMKKKYK